MVIIIAVGLTAAASAQKVAVGIRGHFGSGVYYRPRTTFVVGAYAPLYPRYYYDPFFYGPSYRYYNRPTKLDLEIADIKNDYDDKIWSARQDKSLSGKERRKEIRELKHERDQAIHNAEVDYYKR